VDHQALAVWLGDKLVLLLVLPQVSSTQCSLFHRLTRMMSWDFVRDFLCFLAPGYPHEVPDMVPSSVSVWRIATLLSQYPSCCAGWLAPSPYFAFFLQQALLLLMQGVLIPH
jgi:hypothetical protein